MSTRPLNVDKMRRTLARSRWYARQRNHQHWLDSMTPQHRSRHENPPPGFVDPLCGECLRNASRDANARIMQAMSELESVIVDRPKPSATDCRLRLNRHTPGVRVDTPLGYHFLCQVCGRKCGSRTSWTGPAA